MTDREAPGLLSGLLQAALTLVVAATIGQEIVEHGPFVLHAPDLAIGAMVLTGFVSVGLWVWRKRRAGPGLTTDAMLAQRLAEVERREGEMDTVHARLQELEERLDFSERLLARQEEKVPAVRAHD